MKIVVLYVNTNSPQKSDATAVFIPYAQRFAAHYSRAGHEVATYPVPCSTTRPNRRRTALTALSNHAEIDMLVYFGHGLDKSIQIGFDTSIIDKLAKPLQEKGCKTVCLFACSAANNPEMGFSRKLAEAAQCTVIGHTTAGHAVQNPYLRYYRPDGSYDWFVKPSSPSWDQWRKLLRTDSAYEIPVLQKASFLALLGTKDDTGIGIV